LQFAAKACRKPHFAGLRDFRKLQKLQNIAIPDRKTGLINALQADAAKKRNCQAGAPYCSNPVLSG
jgi:hypothetical protein